MLATNAFSMEKQLSINEFVFGMTPNQVESKIESYGYSLYSSPSDYKNFGLTKYHAWWKNWLGGSEPSKWQFTFIEGKLVLVHAEIRSGLYNTLKKLDYTYNGNVIINYRVSDGMKYIKKQWKGRFRDIPKEFGDISDHLKFNKRKYPSNISRVSWAFRGESKFYKVLYKYRGAFNYQSELFYYTHDYSKRIKDIKMMKKRSEEAKKRRDSQKEYEALTI